jgi:uncharacterized protein YprB with RNaseH-like and TPR domain
VIIRENTIEIDDISADMVLDIEGNREVYKNALFFDLEHYVYKKPICIGVFGCCYYDEASKALFVTQYMIENKREAEVILFMAQDYFKKMNTDYHKKYIITFSGNNDFTVINHLFKKHNIEFDFKEVFEMIDIQKAYEKVSGICIGLKALEKKFDIIRENEPISGANLAKTFSKVIKDDDYISRMPQEKITKILLYNEQDVVSLFHMFVKWNKYVSEEKELTEIIEQPETQDTKE